MVFLYAGHGGYDKNRGLIFTITDPNSPYIDTDNTGASNHLLKSDVLRTIQKRSPRLIVIISSCCSSYATYQGPDICEGVGAANMEPTRPLFRKLFLEASGVVDFTAAQEGYWGYAHLLIDAVCNQMDSNMDKRFGWSQFFPMIQKETAEISKSHYNLAPSAQDVHGKSHWHQNGKLQIPQTPRAFSLGN